LLISSLLSLLIGTIAGLSQTKFKRLLAFSSISHVGFLLLALGIYTQKSVDSFLFYLIQYSVTSLNIFLILLAFSYFIVLPFANLPSVNVNRESLPLQSEGNASQEHGIIKDGSPLGQQEVGSPTDINYIVELKGQLKNNPVLSISMAICLFSMAGVPPLIGFFSKQFVLFSSIENGNNFLSIVAILVSVISASYYLRLIKITFFDTADNNIILKCKDTNEVLCSASPLPSALQGLGAIGTQANGKNKVYEGEKKASAEHASLTLPSALQGLGTPVKLINNNFADPLFLQFPAYTSAHFGTLLISKIHSYLVAILTFLILFFFLDPSILLNVTQLISLTIFNI
jgi:NADH-ubiquinone oxidoreductase chain 2